jgi:two-component system sensor histidine kinase CreC
MYVAAPVMNMGKLIGVITVSKPVASLMPYADRARERVMRAGFTLLAISALIGVIFTLWLTWSLNRLRDYALAVAEGRRATPPVVGGRQLSVLAKSLTLMREKLDGKQYVESYVQSLTHELKSPLTAIRGAAELLEEAPAGEDGQRFARNITEQSARMQRIIDRLLALARVEQLQVPDERREIILSELIDATINSRAGRLAERRLTVRQEGGTSSAVRGDYFLLQQAVGNLLDNAIEFGPEGSQIVVAITAGPHAVRVEVKDNGPGAPDYALPHMFERFYSLPRPDTGLKSTGLGLAFVREVARLHGGNADFANRPEGGAVAWIELPH